MPAEPTTLTALIDAGATVILSITFLLATVIAWRVTPSIQSLIANVIAFNRELTALQEKTATLQRSTLTEIEKMRAADEQQTVAIREVVTTVDNGARETLAALQATQTAIVDSKSEIIRAIEEAIGPFTPELTELRTQITALNQTISENNQAETQKLDALVTDFNALRTSIVQVVIQAVTPKTPDAATVS